MTLSVLRPVLGFSREVYNFPELSKQLRVGAGRFREDCHAEGLLAAICVWGLTGTLQQLMRMFAIGIWIRPGSGISRPGIRRESKQLRVD